MSQDDDDDIFEAVRAAKAQVEADYRELYGESPRAAVLLAVAGLEDELQRLIERKFPPIPAKLAKALFGPGLTPFGAFKSRADVAQAFGYFGPETRKRLDLVASIRNQFAHASRAISFHDDRIFEKCRKLGIGNLTSSQDKPGVEELRDRFIEAVRSLVLQLERHSNYLVELRDPPPPVLP